MVNKAIHKARYTSGRFNPLMATFDGLIRVTASAMQIKVVIYSQQHALAL